MRLCDGKKRYIDEGFASDEELALFDKLTKKDLSKQDIKTLKAVAADLLARVKARIAELDHWTDKEDTRAIVELLIRDTLYSSLPTSFSDADIQTYRQDIYEYIYTRYKDAA